jgi:hypothetical protein
MSHKEKICTNLLLLLKLSGALLASLLLRLALLEESLWDEDLLLGWHAVERISYEPAYKSMKRAPSEELQL